MIEEHTRDVLSIKAKETQVLRMRSDLQSAEEIVEKKQREIDRLKRELARFSRSSSPIASDVSEQLNRDASNNPFYEGNNSPIGSSNDYTARPVGAVRGQKRTSYAPGSVYSHEEKENGSMRENSTGSISSSLSYSRERGGAASPSSSSLRGADGLEPIESWKRAAEVTSSVNLHKSS